nr:unnamed protein product [Digitaria exilis]
MSPRNAGGTTTGSNGSGGAGDAVPQRGSNASAVVAVRGRGHQRDTRRGGGEEERGTTAAEHCGDLGFGMVDLEFGEETVDG